MPFITLETYPSFFRFPSTVNSFNCLVSLLPSTESRNWVKFVKRCSSGRCETSIAVHCFSKSSLVNFVMRPIHASTVWLSTGPDLWLQSTIERLRKFGRFVNIWGVMIDFVEIDFIVSLLMFFKYRRTPSLQVISLSFRQCGLATYNSLFSSGQITILTLLGIVLT